MDPVFELGIKSGMIVVAVGAGTKAVHDAAQTIVGPNAPIGETDRMLANFSRAPSQISSAKIVEKNDISGNLVMKELFSKYVRYADTTWHSFLSSIHERNPEFCIITSWEEPINIQVFDAFGAEGHKSVHAGLMLVYKSFFEDKFVFLSVDLEGIPVEFIENGEIGNEADEGGEVSGKQKNAMTHTIQVQDGLEEIWQFKGAFNIPLLELCNILAKAMKQFPSDYDKFTANCIRFKNIVLTLFENHDANFDKGSQNVPVKPNPIKYLK